MTLIPHCMSYSTCESLSASCPVEATIYGYRPDLGGNAFFLSAFALCTIGQLYLGVRYRTWTWLVAVFTGSLVETIGYAGRVMMCVRLPGRRRYVR